MAHAKQPVDFKFVLYKGMPWFQKIAYKSSSGAAVDMTDWVGRCDVRKTVEGEDVEFSFSTENGSLILSYGEIEFRLEDPTDIPEDFHEGVGHLVVGPTPETATPLTYLGFVLQPVTTNYVP